MPLSPLEAPGFLQRVVYPESPFRRIVGKAYGDKCRWRSTRQWFDPTAYVEDVIGSGAGWDSKDAHISDSNESSRCGYEYETGALNAT